MGVIYPVRKSLALRATVSAGPGFAMLRPKSCGDTRPRLEIANDIQERVTGGQGCTLHTAILSSRSTIESKP